MALPGAVPSNIDQNLRFRLLGMSSAVEKLLGGTWLGSRWRIREEAYPDKSGPVCVLVQEKTAAGWVTRGVVGASWVAPTLENGWVNYGGGAPAAGYTKDLSGWVRLTGLVKSGVIGAAVFTLPVGYRPSTAPLFAVATNTGYGAVQVAVDGGVLAQAGGTGSFSLDGIAFKAEA